MRKTISLITILLTLFVSNRSHAQISFGPKVGLNLAKIVYTSGGEGVNSKMITSFNAGGFVNFKIMDNFYFETGISISGKGVLQELNYKQVLFGDTLTLIGNGKMTPLYIEVPINALYKVDLNGAKLQLFAGPYLAFGIGGNYSNNYIAYYSNSPSDPMLNNESGKITFGSDASKTMQMLDFGLNAGAGIEYSNFFLRFQYGLGLMNLEPNDTKNISVSNRVISIYTGYIIGNDDGGKNKRHKSRHRRRR